MRAGDVLLCRQLRVTLLLPVGERQLGLDAGQVRLAFLLAQAQRGVVEHRQRVALAHALADLRHLDDAAILLTRHAGVTAADDAARRPVARRERRVDRGRHADDGRRRVRLRGRCAGIGVPFHQGEGEDAGQRDGDE
ncbi:MAG: hypothetical protein DI562_14935 [Stenotrophomonas acidaminiphila]|nr:MAG: hypothetical protein DI562_14935 [Stenotrophomonas acidaminiphila]